MILACASPFNNLKQAPDLWNPLGYSFHIAHRLRERASHWSASPMISSKQVKIATDGPVIRHVK